MICPHCNRQHDGHVRSPGATSLICARCTDGKKAAPPVSHTAAKSRKKVQGVK